ncbi:MAG: ribonuclease HI [Clostridia bacterium]|jgi:ribonuclease HI|nr:ribonuclease HI [Clostridia bacterium]MDD4275456.1 ribonuclease HI [Clostridia bacterium]
MKLVEIYTDGACSGNPGAGGWATVLIYKDNIKEISGYEKSTTNNRMELLAVIKALQALKEPCKIKLYTDSAYVVNATINNWTEKWQKNNWKTSSKDNVKNQDLWETLIDLLTVYNVEWIKVKGHSDNKYNNRCDELATGEIKKNAC